MSKMFELLVSVTVVATASWVFALLVRYLLLSIYIVQSSSMEPALRIEDRVCVIRRTALTRRRPADGDIVVVNEPINQTGGRRRQVIKRVLWVEHDENEVANGWWSRPGLRRLFIVGDNVEVSQDSRHYGPVPGDDFVGLAVCIVWPPSRAGLVARLRSGSAE